MTSNRRDQIRFARVPYLIDTEILEATYFSQVFGKHTHEEFAIEVIDAGSASGDLSLSVHNGIEDFLHRGQVHGLQQMVVEPRSP